MGLQSIPKSNREQKNIYILAREDKIHTKILREEVKMKDGKLTKRTHAQTVARKASGGLSPILSFQLVMYV